MRRIKATAEIKALKSIIREQNQEIINLNAQIYELEHQLEESKAKEGKGCLETAIDVMKSICNAISDLSPDELKALADGNYDADCVDDCDFDCEHCDCDFDCEHCERSKPDEEDDNNAI